MARDAQCSGSPARSGSVRTVSGAAGPGRSTWRAPTTREPLPGSAAGSAAGGCGGTAGLAGIGVRAAGSAPGGSPPGAAGSAAGRAGCEPAARRRRESSGSSGIGEPCRLSPAIRGRVSRNCEPPPGSPQACSQPPCSRASSSGDRQAEPGAAGGPGPGRVGPPEAVEDQGGLAGLEAHAVVADGHGDRAGRTGQAHHDVPALAVLDGVDHQVAQDPFDPAGVDLGDARGARRRAPRRLPLRSASGSAASTTRCTTSRRSTGSASSTAAPASKRLISSRSASSDSNRSSWVCSSSAERAVAGSKLLAGVVDHVGRHPDRGQRGAQLVRDVGDEPALHPGEFLELLDLASAGCRPSC